MGTTPKKSCHVSQPGNGGARCLQLEYDPMKGAPEIPTPAPGRGAQNSDPKIKNARCRLAMSIQQQIAYEITREKVGSELKLLVDQPHIARSEADAPDVDARVVLSRARRSESLFAAKLMVTADMTCWPESKGSRSYFF